MYTVLNVHLLKWREPTLNRPIILDPWRLLMEKRQGRRDGHEGFWWKSDDGKKKVEATTCQSTSTGQRDLKTKRPTLVRKNRTLICWRHPRNWEGSRWRKSKWQGQEAYNSVMTKSRRRTSIFRLDDDLNLWPHGRRRFRNWHGMTGMSEYHVNS